MFVHPAEVPIEFAVAFQRIMHDQGDEYGPILLQGATTTPPSLACMADTPVECACLVGTIGLIEGLETVAEVNEFFTRMCFEADQKMGEPAGCRHLLNWFDETDISKVRPAMIEELK